MEIEQRDQEIDRLNDQIASLEGELKNEIIQAETWRDRATKEIGKLEEENQSLVNELNVVQ